MDDTLCYRFFREPSCAPQRQYETLRAVFLDGDRPKDVAERFGYDYDAFRQLIGQFRAACANGSPPPFSTHPGREGHPAAPAQPGPGPSSRRQPIAVSSVGLPGDGCGPASPVSSFSYRCWPGSRSIT